MNFIFIFFEKYINRGNVRKNNISSAVLGSVHRPAAAAAAGKRPLDGAVNFQYRNLIPDYNSQFCQSFTFCIFFGTSKTPIH